MPATGIHIISILILQTRGELGLNSVLQSTSACPIGAVALSEGSKPTLNATAPPFFSCNILDFLSTWLALLCVSSQTPLCLKRRRIDQLSILYPKPNSHLIKWTKPMNDNPDTPYQAFAIFSSSNIACASADMIALYFAASSKSLVYVSVLSMYASCAASSNS